MARRSNRQNTEPTPAEQPQDEGTVQTEAPAEGSKPEAPAEVDLTAFREAVEAAVAEADNSTGEVPVASIEAVTTQYRQLEGIKAKNAAKALVNEGMKDQMSSDNLAGARAYLNIQEKALVAASGSTKTERAPADPTEAFVQRVAVLRLGYHLVTSSVPEGVNDGWEAKVEEVVNEAAGQADAYRSWLNDDSEDRGDEPEVSAVVKNAVKLAEGKTARAGSSARGGSTFEGPRRDIAAHIVNAFADKEVGTFLKIAEIRNVRSEEYGDNPPSAGAISARLFPKSGNSTMEKLGVQPAEQDGRKGAVKIDVE